MKKLPENLTWFYWEKKKLAVLFRDGHWWTNLWPHYETPEIKHGCWPVQKQAQVAITMAFVNGELNEVKK